MSNEKLLINNPKSNNSEDMSNKQIEEMAKVIDKSLMSELGLRLNDEFLVRLAEHHYSEGYRKQSEVVEEYRQKVNTKMGKHTHLLGKEYVQRILREVAKEMKGGAE